MADVTTKLFLEEFEVMVDIGIHDFEINNPQRVCISVEVLLDPNAGDRPDEIGSTFDYDFIRLEIKNLISNRRFNLQETLCRLILEKIIEKIPFWNLNLGAKIHEKSKKIDVKKAFVLRCVFFIDFLRFCIDFGSSKPSIFGPNLAIK